MAKYDLKELQERILQILVGIDKVCREHGLTYYLAYGTMLGAYRHKGFIPWDDDLDVCMPRPDYEKFIAQAHEWLPEHLEFICPELDKNYPIAFGKVQDNRTTLIERIYLKYLGGIYCDVFPLDGVPQNPLRRRLHIMQYFVCSHLLYQLFRDPYKHGHGPNSWFSLVLHWLFSRNAIQRRIRRLLMKYPYGESKDICLFDDSTRCVMPRTVFGKPQEVDFGGHNLWGVEKPEEYLTKIYGPTYMQLPPENQRRQHGFYYLDFNLPYKEYKD